MAENTALCSAVNSVQALGRGFDVNFDTRLLYSKGGVAAGSTVVVIDQDLSRARDVALFDDLVVPNVSRDIFINILHPDDDASVRLSSGVLTFDEMVQYFNKKANISGHTPLGSFNAAFSYTGSKHMDVASTKTLSTDGFFIPLAKFELLKSPMILQENVRRAVPTSWDPPALASFIENFGTHVITSVTIGGKDVIYVKQHKQSSLSAMEIKSYVQDIGNQRFSSTESLRSSGLLKYKDKGIDPFSFNSQGIHPQPSDTTFLPGNGKEDVTVIFRRRGGDDLEQSHTQWTRTVRCSPDVIEMQFFPIAALFEDVRGREHLMRAIDLYLEYKPHIEELRYFLEFQVPRIWAPLQDSRLPGPARKEPVCPSLQFSLMGQKLYVSSEQVTVGRKPVTGMRLSLEGPKKNRLCIQLQHLASLPKIFGPYWDTHVGIGAPKWQGNEEQDSRWFEAVKWKKFSHVSTAPIESPETLVSRDFSSVDAHIVTGAQLGVWDSFGSSHKVLHMKLLYSRVPGCSIRRSVWDDEEGNGKVRKAARKSSSGGDSSSSSSSSSSGWWEEGEVSESGKKLGKIVECMELSKGPEDGPGHWVVTGGKLEVEKGKIRLRLKYSLLNY